jgi:DNA-binding transcriptional MerR regulator
VKPQMPERLWSVDDVSAYLGVPVQTVRCWRSKNYGPPARKIGKHLRYDPDAVCAWVDGLGDNAA